MFPRKPYRHGMDSHESRMKPGSIFVPVRIARIGDGNDLKLFYSCRMEGKRKIMKINRNLILIWPPKTKMYARVILVLAQLVSINCVHAGGLVAAWGDDSWGQTTLPVGVNDVKAISAGYNHSLALKSDGTVVAWGHDYDGDTRVPPDLPRATAIAAGLLDSLILKPDGTVMSWGGNYYGSETNVPAGLSNVVAIAAGWYHSLALKSDGTVVAWGYSYYGQTNVPARLSDVIAIAAGGYHNLALRADGTVAAWGDSWYGQTNVPIGLSNVVAIAAGGYHSLALKSDGTVVAWGSDGQGQTNVPPGLSNVVAIAAGYLHSLALKANGTIAAWGYNYYGETNVPVGLSNATAIAAAGNSSYALVFSGPVQITQNPQSQTVYSPYTSNIIFSVAATGAGPLSYQWFLNGTAFADNSHVNGSTSVTMTLSGLQPADIGTYTVIVSNAFGRVASSTVDINVIGQPLIVSQPVSQLAYAGYSAMFSINAKGSLPLSYQWRFDGADIPGATNATLTLINLTLAQVGYYHVVVSNPFGQVISAKALLSVETTDVVVWGNNTPTNLPSGLTNLEAVAAGFSHIVGLHPDGTIKVWATPNYSDSTNVPPGATNVVSVAAGINNMALRSDGTVISWGSFVVPSPTGLTNFIAVAEKYAFALALKSDNTVVAWGDNAYGQTNVPPGLSNVIAIAAGDFHSLAVKCDGSVVAWGNNQSGQINVPTGLTNVIAVAGGYYHSLALKANGTVAAWGGNFPDANVPHGLSNVVAIAAGYYDSLALKADGSLVSWGSYPAFSMPPGLSNVFAIASGDALGFNSFDVALVGTGSPHITIQPMSQTPAHRASVHLHARAVGVQPMSYQWQWNGQNIPGATNDDLTITNAPGAYQMIAANVLGTVISRVAQVTVPVVPINTNLGAALNATNLVWTTYSYNRKQQQGYGLWFAENQVTHDGDAAAQSGAITNSEQSILQTTVTGPGTLMFWWKVSSEADYDFLNVYLDNSNAAAVSGEVDWQQRSLLIPSGAHTLKWIYAKDISVSAGQDAGWLDQVAFMPAPLITQQPQSQTAWMGSNATFQAGATWSGIANVQWLKNGTNLPDAHSMLLTLTNLTRRDSGMYTLQISNVGGGVTSSNASLVVLVPQRLSAPRLLPDGSFVFSSDDADGAPLQPGDLAGFQVQASTNLVDWNALPGALTLTSGVLQLDDSAATNASMRFYRIIENR
jgi:alpha-tubulin suppressor-like RCC1 family protein